ncbi:helix-turn-helix domain-containing protein [Deinococcus sp.]|uniref:helix-turn-helix domain-containing protein n=1 Tax=Deinococcus sp. TaxID=47478 RepID=UPI0025BC6BA7|nr:helix-turn-helix domain-containing protein [Deinococcus sp.]
MFGFLRGKTLASSQASPRPVANLATILEAVAHAPRTPGELAHDLGSTQAALEGMLRTLHSSGYVQEAVQGSGDCSCGPCALKSLCRNAGGDVPPLNLLRLTPRGEAYLRRVTGAGT